MRDRTGGTRACQAPRHGLPSLPVFRVYKFRSGADSATDWEGKYRAEGRPSANPADYARQPFVRTIENYLRPGVRLFDAGCGTGGLLWYFRQKGARVAGVDTAAAAVDTACRLVPDAEVAVSAIDRLPVADRTIDLYLAIGSWEYPPDGPAAAAREAARVLKPGGLAFIEVPHANLSRRLAYIPLKRLEQWVHTFTGKGVGHLFARVPDTFSARFSHHLFRIGEMHAILRGAGFAILETHPHDLPEPTRHYGLWVDWPVFRGGPHYELNALGRLKKRVLNALSPWTIATGMFIVARKR